MGNTVRFKASLDDRVSGGLARIRDNFDRLGKTQGFKTLVQGVGVGAGISAWGMATDAIRGATAALGDAIQAAVADEQSQARLYTAVEQNARAWDGNREAIEGVIRERMKLAFTDEEQRDSLALLVAKTGDVNEALRIQRVAMDLARLKGIELADASRAIALGMEGQGRALKELGINVKDVTSKQEVLTRVQEKAAGQAESYADSTAGAMATLQITVDELAESIGYELLPYVKDFAETIRDDVLPNVDLMADALGMVPYIIDPIGAAMGRAREETERVREEAEKLKFEQLAEGAEAWDTYTEAAASSREASLRSASAIKAVGETAQDTRRQLDELEDKIRDVARTARDESLDKHYDLSTIDDKIILAKAEVASARRELEQAETNEQRAAARIRIAEAERELTSLVNKSRDMKDDFGKAGALLGRSLGSALYNEVVRWNSLTRREIARLGETRATGPGRNSSGPERRAGGGPVAGGRTYWVGEEGPELFVPKAAGTVVPTESLVPSAGSAGAVAAAPAPVNIAVYLDSDQIAARVERRQYFAASVAPVSAR